MEKTTEVKKSKKDRILITIIASIIAPFIVFVAVPMIIFENNLLEFLFDWSDFVPVCLLIATALSAIIFFAIIFLPEKIYKICLHILIAIDVLVFLQNTYLNGNLLLSGDNLGAGAGTAAKVINLAIWILVVAGAIVLAVLKDKKKYIKTGALILCVIVSASQLISTVVPIISNKNFFKTRIERVTADVEAKAADAILYSTYKDVNKYSTTGNIYYFLIDMWDERYAEVAYETKPDIYDNLTGFTWYKDCVALYGHTYPAVAYALTGTEHSPELYNSEYMKKAYEENNYLLELKNAGYKINICTDIGTSYARTGLPSYINNAVACKQVLQNKTSLIKKILKLGLYASLPTIVKSAVGNITSEDFELDFKTSTLDDIDSFGTNHRLIKEHIDEISLEATTDKQFTFFHMSGTHGVNTSDQTQDKSATKLTQFCMDVINVFIQNLKDKGLYDEATIVITADHSFVFEHPAPIACFFKPAQTEAESQQPFKISTAKVAQKNIMPSIFDSIGVTSEIAVAKGDTPLHLTDLEERRFVYHTYGNDGFKEMIFKITGSLQALGNPHSNWTKVSETYWPDRHITD